MYSTGNRKGAALIIAIIFITIFAALLVSLSSMCIRNLQQAQNQVKAGSALSAAESGFEVGRYIVASTVPLLESTNYNFVTKKQADKVWKKVRKQVQAQPWVNNTADVTADEIITKKTTYNSKGKSFQVRFYRSDPLTIQLEGIGTDGDMTRSVSAQIDISKDSEVLSYAIASRGKIWLTGDSTVYGNIYSLWDRVDISPFNMTSNSRVEGIINTALALDDIQEQGGLQDAVQCNYYGIRYGQSHESMPGMDISHYDTDLYYNMVMTGNGNGNIPSSGTIETEYFPHASAGDGGYDMPRDGTPDDTWNRRLNRHVYENLTFTNQRLPGNRNALFRNCTFEGVLYIDCQKNGSSQYNNVRFEDCSFNGPIVTNVPQEFKWKNNCLYFTGEATFNNTSNIQEATILAPHFNVNLGNTNPGQSDNNVLTGVIVGGIVDIRGNAQINGTIISMCDTTGWDSGYATNIGTTLGDGGSETTELGNISTISIRPEEGRRLPSGITSPIVLITLYETYSEGS